MVGRLGPVDPGISRGVRSSGPASSRMCRSSGVRINVRNFCFRSVFFFMFVFVLSVAVFRPSEFLYF